MVILRMSLLFIVLQWAVTLSANDDCLDLWGLQPEVSPVMAVTLAPDVHNHSTAVELIRKLPHDVDVILMIPKSRVTTPQPNINYTELLQSHPRAQLLDSALPFNSWTRDYMPQLVKRRDGSWELVQFKYSYSRNSSYDIIQRSKTSGYYLAKKYGLNHRFVELEIQGGAFLVDGQRRLFITDSKQSRMFNKQSKYEMEIILKEALDVESVHWFEGLPHEATGHIDLFAKYLGRNTMLVASSSHPERGAFLNDIALRMQNEFGFKVVRVQNGSEIEATPSQRMTLIFSYTNSLIVNERVYVPQYAEGAPPHLKEALLKADALAVDAYQAAGFAAENIYSVPSYNAIQWGGAVHCLSCQINKPNL